MTCYRGDVRATLVLLAALAACEPSYDGTAFRCDDTRGCPEDQTCITGRCRRVAPVAILCDKVTCAADQQCCADVVNPPRCIPASEICPGASALCDSRDDCAAGERCCDTAGGAVCAELCESEVACATDADCPGDVPHCCSQPIVPWGACRLIACDD